MKLAGMHYLHVTLKPTIEEVRWSSDLRMMARVSMRDK